MTQKELWNFEGEVKVAIYAPYVRGEKTRLYNRIESKSYLECLKLVKETFDTLNQEGLEVGFPLRFTLRTKDSDETIIMLVQEQGIFGLDRDFERLVSLNH